MNILFSLPKDVMWSFVYSCPYFTLALNPLTVFFSPDRFKFDNQPAVCILSLSTILLLGKQQSDVASNSCV